MSKDEKEARDWLLNEENLGTDDYDIDLADRRLVEDIEYESGGKSFEYSLEEEKLEIEGREYTALRVYDSGGVVAAEIYDGDGSDRKTSREFDDMNFTTSHFPEISALSVLSNLGGQDETGKNEGKEKAVAGAVEGHELEFDLDEL